MKITILLSIVLLAFSTLQTQNVQIAENIASNITQRVKTRSFPSVFQAWGGILNKQGEDKQVSFARHDLSWWGICDEDGLVWDCPVGTDDRILATKFTEASIVNGLNFRNNLLVKNPNVVLLANLNYRGAKAAWLPYDHEWWMRDAGGNRIVSQVNTDPTKVWYRLDFQKPALRTQVATWAAAAVNSGVYDGVLIDWWDENIATELDARMDMIQQIRNAIPNGLIIVNSNDRKPTKAAPYINGVFMETGTKTTRATTPARWVEIQNTLEWNQANVLEPKLVCLEIWYQTNFDEPSRMRAATTMSLTLSDGYVLFGEDNDAAGVDHKHWWYDFWNKSLGKAVGGLNSLQANGTYMREFENGYAVYNPMGNGQVTVTFPVNYIRVSTGASAKVHNIHDQDGEIFLRDLNTAIIPVHALPSDFALSQNYPNPFRDETNISFLLPADAKNTNLSVYNMLGEKVKLLVDENKTAGVYLVKWDGTSNEGRRMANGIYFYKLQMGSNVPPIEKKMLFMR